MRPVSDLARTLGVSLRIRCMHAGAISRRSPVVDCAAPGNRDRADGARGQQTDQEQSTRAVHPDTRRAIDVVLYAVFHYQPLGEPRSARNVRKNTQRAFLKCQPNPTYSSKEYVLSVNCVPAGSALGLLMVALLGTGGAVGLYSISSEGMDGMMSGNHTVQCAAKNAECAQDHTACAQEMREGTHQECASMGMTPETCQTMHDQMSMGMMGASCH